MDTSDDPILRAMQLLKSALGILDEAGASADIGAHVEVAISRLGEVLDQSDQADQAAHEARQ
ncbi:MAG TPA: hypothetical protein VK474_13765 [Chthoniobacterales bacterium]|nr:hypothetical protein [Chthoniobacterales bacterium]